MPNDPSYTAFWRSLDPDTQQVIERMDEHENLGHAHNQEISQAMIQLLARVHDDLEALASRLGGEQETATTHLETLLLILSFSPNGGSYWFTRELVEARPEVYEHLYHRVLTQKPLQQHGKLLRERMLFYMLREQVKYFVFSPETRLAVKEALEVTRRA